jgi:hypothetical protein
MVILNNKNKTTTTMVVVVVVIITTTNTTTIVSRLYNFVFCLPDVLVSVIDFSCFGLSGHLKT